MINLEKKYIYLYIYIYHCIKDKIRKKSILQICRNTVFKFYRPILVTITKTSMVGNRCYGNQKYIFQMFT